MNERRLRGLMGLSIRARQSVFGADACEKALRDGSAGLLLLDGGASEKTAERYRQICDQAQIPMYLLRQDLMGEATGRPGVAMVIRKGGMADQMLDCCREAEKA